MDQPGIFLIARTPTGPKISRVITSEKPMMALSGVRSSWLILARKAVLARDGALRLRRALRSARAPAPCVRKYRASPPRCRRARPAPARPGGSVFPSRHNCRRACLQPHFGRAGAAEIGRFHRSAACIGLQIVGMHQRRQAPGLPARPAAGPAAPCEAGLAKRMRPSGEWRVIRSIALSARKRYIAAPSAAAVSAARWRSCAAVATSTACTSAASTEHGIDFPQRQGQARGRQQLRPPRSPATASSASAGGESGPHHRGRGRPPAPLPPAPARTTPPAATATPPVRTAR